MWIIYFAYGKNVRLLVLLTYLTIKKLHFRDRLVI